jgi:hypothetical protein
MLKPATDRHLKAAQYGGRPSQGEVVLRDLLDAQVIGVDVSAGYSWWLRVRDSNGGTEIMKLL